MRASGSLKLGTIHASELLRSLLRSTRPSALAQAIMEVGELTRRCTFLIILMMRIIVAVS